MSVRDSKEFGGTYLALRFYYYYNMDAGAPAKHKFSISPAEATAALGSSVQFHARQDDNQEDVAVTWNITGCNDCGTMSATGLYTAPLKLPNSPKVKISAKRISNFLPDTVQATVTVIAAEP